MKKVENNKIKILLLGLFILGMINIPNLSRAQDSQIMLQEDEVSVETSPVNPEPYEDVTITLTSYATDLNKATISWSDDSGVVLLSGLGKTSYTFKAGKSGSISVFNINIIPSGATSIVTKRIAISPSEVEIMWEAVDGYTPPFYKGKSLPVSGGLIKAVAIPNTDTIKSGIGSITYTWKNNDTVMPDVSGYNKNSYVFKNSVFDDVNNIGVVASSVSDNYQAEKNIEIPVYQPQIIFYKKSPTEGVLYNNALYKETTMKEDEMTLVAEPFFLSLKDNERNFSFTWQINGKNIPTPVNKSELTVRPASRGGFATINLDIENLNELFQKASSLLTINL